MSRKSSIRRLKFEKSLHRTNGGASRNQNYSINQRDGVLLSC
ncbi:hypothetical protein [Azospirillum doebereinerae]